MTSNNPFRVLTNPIFSELMRRERERSELVERAFGLPFRLQEHLNALESPLSRILNTPHVAEITAARMFGEHCKHLATPHWATSIEQSAIQVAQRNFAGGFDRMASLGISGGALAGILNAQNQSASLRALMAGSQWAERLKVLSEQLSPSFGVFNGIAHHMALAEKLSLRLSDEDVRSIAEDVALQMSEAQRLIEALGKVESPEEGIAKYISFLTLLTMFFVRFGENTLDEFRKLGLVGLLGLISAVYAFMPNEQASGWSEEQGIEFAELRAAVDAMQAQLQKAQETNAALDEAFIAGLVRGELSRKSNIRMGPFRDAAKILTAPAGTQIALIRSQGSWNFVVLRDPLTSQLLQGWVYGTTVETFQLPPSAAKTLAKAGLEAP